MSYNSNKPRAEYSATATQTAFPFLFKIYVDTDIKVYQTLAGQDPDDVADLLELAVDYTVTVNGDAGGEITLLTGAGNGDAITLLRSLDINRLTEYQQNGDLLATTLNLDQEYQTYLIADQKAVSDRNIKLSENSQNVSSFLPAPIGESYLRWKLDGTAIENDTTIPDAVTEAANSASEAANSASEAANSATLVKDKLHTVATIADMLLLDSNIYPNVNVKDSGENGIFNYDATQSAVNDGGTVLNGWVRQYTGALNVRWFGADGDNVSDDTLAIQAAVDTGKAIYFPIGTYRITDTITVSTRGQGLFGEAASIGGKSDITTNDFGSVIQFDIGDADPAQEMFRVTESQVSFTYLKFKGDSVNSDDIGIVFNKVTNTDDMDGYVLFCGFYQVRDGIHFYSRALQAEQNVFSSCSYPITLDWDSSAESGLDIQTHDLYKGRATRINSNRFHGGVFSVTVQNYLQRGAIYSNNTVDIGQGFIRVQNGGGLYGCVIDGNVGDMLSQTFLKMDALTTCLDVVLSNNKMGGVIAGTVDGDDKRPFSVINFDGLAELKGLIFSANTVTGTDANAINFRNDAASPLITLSSVLITGNTFRQIGLDGVAAREIVNSVFDIADFLFTDNIISEEGGTVTSIISTASKTITDATVKHNIYNPALPLFSSTTLAGRQDVDNKQGIYGATTTGAFQLGDLGGYTSSLPFLLSRLSSTGGVGTRYQNSLGYIDIFGAPTAAGDGNFIAGTDNKVGLGTAANRWQEVYAGTGTINTSDEREKQQIKTLNEAELRVALKLKQSIKKFKFNDAVEAKGDKARIHIGVIAQEVVAIFDSEGLNAFEYSILCHDEWIDEDTKEQRDRYGIRYEELLGFIIGAI